MNDADADCRMRRDAQIRSVTFGRVALGRMAAAQKALGVISLYVLFCEILPSTIFLVQENCHKIRI